MGYPIYYNGEITATPALNQGDAAIFTTIVNLQTSEAAQPILDAISRQVNAEIPYHGELLVLSEDGATICPEEGESRGGVAAWVELLLTHFFIPRGYGLSGSIEWAANDDPADRGAIYVDGGKLEVVQDRIENPGPSWKPVVYMSEKVKELIQSLVESASSEGCSPDLTVVAAAELKALQDAVAA